jgi:hypothetical protein
VLDEIGDIVAHRPAIRILAAAPCVLGTTFECGLHFDLSFAPPHVDKLQAFRAGRPAHMQV